MRSTTRDAAFALEFAQETPPLVRNVTSFSWTADVLKVLKQIRDHATSRAKQEDDDTFVNLPFASLRAQLHLATDQWAAIRDDVGLRSLYVASGQADAWGFLASDHYGNGVREIRDAFAYWSEGPLARFCANRDVDTLGIDALRRLNLDDRVAGMSPSSVQIFPWSTAQVAGGPTPFHVTAGMLAARLAGHELFPGLGPVVRVVGGADHNSAEVITRPFHLAGGRFSLVCEITMETLPGASKPLIYCRFKRRRWANNIKMGYTPSSSIGAFVFPHLARPESAYRFSVIRRDTSWTTDLAYPQYEHAFGLALGHDDERVLNYPCDERASVVVMTKADVTDHTGSALQAGVPLVDQADAFDRITEVLYELGLRPFSDFRAVKAAVVKAPPLSMLKAEVTLARLLERRADEDEALTVEDSLLAATAAPAVRWFRSGVPPPDQQHDRVISAIRALTADTAYLKDQTRRILYVVSQVPEDVEWIKTTASAMLDDSFKVVSAPLPSNTHGPRGHLPVENGARRQRFDARVREWLNFAHAISLPERAMVLIQAPRFYSVPGGKVKPDDRVNKLAARKALATLGCTVQYLLPSDPGRLDKFLPRVQASLLDLVFGHAGSVWGLRQACSACFATPSLAPRWVGAIGSLTVQSELGDRAQSVFVATRLECETGRAWVRFAHQQAEPVITDWMRFDEGARYLVARRIELPRTRVGQRTLLAQFFQNTFDQMATLDSNAVVFLDSTRLAGLASWLSDKGVANSTRVIGDSVVAGERWPTLRLLRIREQAPTIGQEKFFEPMSSEESSQRTWTSTQRLFSVGDTAVSTYWSLARPSTHHKRGASCYREMLLPNSRKSDENPEDFALYPAQPDKQHLNSRAVEVVVLQKHYEDDAVQLASFAQHLRAGMLTARNDRWTTTPSPLRIIEKLAEYMKA
ncbi:RNaseH domain-containing protein [Paraburkholderia caribensis]|uniref:RNaseH domain-containing protein n=1 Tax=Paraburkholderia caribensis TaxID=75105 RepID=UPI0031DE3EB6